MFSAAVLQISECINDFIRYFFRVLTFYKLLTCIFLLWMADECQIGDISWLLRLGDLFLDIRALVASYPAEQNWICHYIVIHIYISHSQCLKPLKVSCRLPRFYWVHRQQSNFDDMLDFVAQWRSPGFISIVHSIILSVKDPFKPLFK